MSPRYLAVAIVLAAACTTNPKQAAVPVVVAPPPAAATPPPVVDRETIRREVGDAERAFARTMVHRDHAAFTSFLADDAIFFAGTTPLRGKQAIADAWLRFYQGAEPPFSWEPEIIEVLEPGDLGLTRGRILDASGTQTGIFTSLWRRGADGRWRVLFDAGCNACAPAKRAPEGS